MGIVQCSQIHEARLLIYGYLSILARISCFFTHLSVNRSTDLFIHHLSLSVYLFIYQPICLIICLSAYLSLFIYLLTSLFIYLPVYSLSTVLFIYTSCIDS